jgi:ketosteroid isomerase-like protein
LTRAEAVRLAQSYVAAYNDRDLHAMLALQDENVVSYPTPLFGHRPHIGHAGVRAWWEAMMAAGLSYEVVVSDVLGEVRDHGERLSPWGALVRVRNGLIIESRSYLSDKELLDEVGLLG